VPDFRNPALKGGAPLSRGLGKIQRGLLLALARIEVRAAEGAAQEQRQYRPPTRAGIRRVLYVACQHELREPLVPKMRDEYGLQLAIDQMLEKRGHWQLLCEMNSATWRRRIVSRLSCQARDRESSAMAPVKAEKVVSIAKRVSPTSSITSKTLTGNQLFTHRGVLIVLRALAASSEPYPVVPGASRYRL
jgi:hypothetical protein